MRVDTTQYPNIFTITLTEPEQKYIQGAEAVHDITVSDVMEAWVNFGIDNSKVAIENWKLSGH